MFSGCLLFSYINYVEYWNLIMNANTIGMQYVAIMFWLDIDITGSIGVHIYVYVRLLL